MPFSLDSLNRALRNAAAIRSISRLQPVGGSGDKVFPPTYATDDPSSYAKESRRIDGVDVPCVLLDSVASQANRQEQALLEAWEDGLKIPFLAVDFTDEDELGDMGAISIYDAPHRVADALLRDGLLDGVPFRATERGRAFTDATPQKATALYRICPHALVFGVWDSTGPKGGLGSKFARCLTSEIVGIGMVEGVKTSSRLDPAGIGSGTTIYEGTDGSWTMDEAAAMQDKKNKPVKHGTGRPSEINHGNVTPSIEVDGGVTLDYAQQTWVLSLAGLRRLRFPTRVDGSMHADEARRPAERAARAALAALGLAACAFARRDGYDLRSRCVLWPEGPLSFEILAAEGGEPETFTLSLEESESLLHEALAEAEKHGMGWDLEPVRMQPMPKLAELIRRSRALQVAAPAGEDEE